MSIKERFVPDPQDEIRDKAADLRDSIAAADGSIFDKLQALIPVGKDGDDGKDGIGISDVSIDSDGHLIIFFTDESSVDVGNVVGKDGEDGEKGDDGDQGRGISNARIDINGHLIITFTDGAETDVGRIVGANGKDGKDGKRGEKGDDGDPGETGPMPDHQWDGSKIRFEKPDGSWGNWVELRGPSGVISGGAGGVDYARLAAGIIPYLPTIEDYLTIDSDGYVVEIDGYPLRGSGGGDVELTLDSDGRVVAIDGHPVYGNGEKGDPGPPGQDGHTPVINLDSDGYAIGIDGIPIIPAPAVDLTINSDGYVIEIDNYPIYASGGGDGEIDGGSANSVYLPSQTIDGGDAIG